jgi:DNA-binding IclR family transcriptional regulator
MMTEGKYYSVKDLANLTGENKGTTAEIVRFLAKYGFIEQAGWDDTVYTKSKIIISPEKSIELLKALVQTAI